MVANYNKAFQPIFDSMEKYPPLLQWHSWMNAKVSIAYNLGYKEIMLDAAAVRLDEISGR